jgi:hypothetical protein
MGIHTLLHFKLKIKEFTTPKKEILSWPYVTAESHRFGGIEFRYSKREMGDIHGERLADLPFPMTTRNELVNSGRASPHQRKYLRRPIAMFLSLSVGCHYKSYYETHEFLLSSVRFYYVVFLVVILMMLLIVLVLVLVMMVHSYKVR